MPAKGPKVGHKMKLYRNSGTVESPTWVEVAEIGDVSIPDLSRGMAELKRRGHDHTKSLPTLIQAIAVEFRMIHGLDATNFDAIRSAFFAGTTAQWAVMNGAIAESAENEDNEGLVIPAFVEQFPWDQPLEDVSGHDVRLAYAYMEDATNVEVDLEWLEVASGV